MMRGDSLRWSLTSPYNGPLKWCFIGHYVTHPLGNLNYYFLLENIHSKKSSSSGSVRGTKMVLTLSGGGKQVLFRRGCGKKWEVKIPVKRLSPFQRSPDILTKTSYLYKSYQQFLVLTV